MGKEGGGGGSGDVGGVGGGCDGCVGGGGRNAGQQVWQLAWEYYTLFPGIMLLCVRSWVCC